MKDEVDVDEPQLPRRQKRPARYGAGEAPAEFHSTPAEYFRQFYFEALDLSILNQSKSDLISQGMEHTSI